MVFGGKGFSGMAVGETGEDHGEGVIGGQREIGALDVGFELIHEAGENWVGETV